MLGKQGFQLRLDRRVDQALRTRPQRLVSNLSTRHLNHVILIHSDVTPNGYFYVSQQQINQIRRLFSIPQTQDSVITPDFGVESSPKHQMDNISQKQ